MKSNNALALTLALCAGLAHAQPTPVTGDLLVNTPNTAAQSEARVASTGSDGFVVTWYDFQGFATDLNGAVVARRFDAAGNPLGSEFRVNAATADQEREPDVASDAAGNFVVVYRSANSSTYASAILGERYSSTGGSQGGISPFFPQSGTQELPAVGRAPNGNFLVVWQGQIAGSGDSTTGIHAVLYDSAGNALTSRFLVNSFTTLNQTEPSVAALGNAGFIVTWTSLGGFGTDTDMQSIQGQVLNPSATPMAGQFQINSFTSSIQSQSNVKSDGSAGFAVTWSSFGSLGGGGGPTDADGSIQFRRFNSSATPLASETQANLVTTLSQSQPNLLRDAVGGWVLTWTSFAASAPDTDSATIRGRQFSSAGSPVGSEFQVNSHTTGPQSRSSLALVGTDFVVTWHGEGPGDTSGVVARIFSGPVPPTSTPTQTPSGTATSTSTRTATGTVTSTASITSTPLPSSTPTETPTRPTSTRTATRTSTGTQTGDTPTVTPTSEAPEAGPGGSGARLGLTLSLVVIGVVAMVQRRTRRSVVH